MSQKQWTLAVLPGDGIGPEVTRAAISVLQDCAGRFNFRIELVELPFGGNAIDDCGQPFPQETLKACLKSDAVLLGAVGGPRWDALPLNRRPEAGLLALRRELGVLCQRAPDPPARTAAGAFTASIAGRYAA
jgi:3-isopropylmalate dehydrogenase